MSRKSSFQHIIFLDEKISKFFSWLTDCLTSLFQHWNLRLITQQRSNTDKKNVAIEMENRWDGPALLVGMANGYHGYIPTEQAFSEGGYEVLPNEDSRYEPDSDKKLLEGMFHIQDMLQETK